MHVSARIAPRRTHVGIVAIVALSGCTGPLYVPSGPRNEQVAWDKLRTATFQATRRQASGAFVDASPALDEREGWNCAENASGLACSAATALKPGPANAGSQEGRSVLGLAALADGSRCAAEGKESRSSHIRITRHYPGNSGRFPAPRGYSRLLDDQASVGDAFLTIEDVEDAARLLTICGSMGPAPAKTREAR